MKMILKISLVLLLSIFLTTTEAKLTKEETDDANDEKYQSLIIGRWVEDKDHQQIMRHSGYIEYFADGRSLGKLFADETCTESMTFHGYWKISNGNLYYKTEGDEEWGMDRIIKMTDSHYVVRSKDQMLYRKKGTFCDDYSD